MLLLLAATTLALLGGLRAEQLQVQTERNSLSYIYTAFSKPTGLPNIHQFTAIGLLDNRPIDYYDSTKKMKVPRETWMEEELEADYWLKGTESRRTKEQWFQVNLDILTHRLAKNDSVNHVLQWSHGCELSDSGVVTGTNRYSYDGHDFLSFDSEHKQWVAPMFGAQETKRKWDSIQQLNDYTDGYLHKECAEWLTKFLKYKNKAHREAWPPVVYFKAKPHDDHLSLSCFATGFYPREITLNIRRNTYLLDTEDGLRSTMIRPNGDGTYQIKKWVNIHKNDGANYSCEVIHKGSGVNILKHWVYQEEESSSKDGEIFGVAVAVVLLVLLVVGVPLYLYLRRRRQNTGSAKSVFGSTRSDSGSASSDSEHTSIQKGEETYPLNGSTRSDSEHTSIQKGKETSPLTGSNRSDSGNSSASDTSLPPLAV